MRLPDYATGLFICGLGGLAAYGGSLLPPVRGQQIGPNVFPMVVGIGLMICGALVALGIGRTFEDEAEADVAASESAAAAEGAGAAPEPAGFLYGLRVLLPPGLLLFYVLAVERIGFIATASVLVFVAAVALGARLKLAVPLALLAPIGVHLVFYKLLRVPLPEGLIPMPW